MLELSKDKHNASLLDRQLVQFQGSVNRVESELSGQIRYLTQVRDTGAVLVASTENRSTVMMMMMMMQFCLSGNL